MTYEAIRAVEVHVIDPAIDDHDEVCVEAWHLRALVERVMELTDALNDAADALDRFGADDASAAAGAVLGEDDDE